MFGHRLIAWCLLLLLPFASSHMHHRVVSRQTLDSQADRCRTASWPFKLYILTIPVAPFIYVDVQENSTVFSGFSYDLLQALAVNMNFCYELHALPASAMFQDIINEVNNKSTSWNMAISAITITGSRLQV